MTMKQIVFIITVFLQSSQARHINQLFRHWNNNILDDVELEPPIISSDCEDDDICKNVSNYPMDLVLLVLQQLAMDNITMFTIDRLHMENTDYENLCSFKDEALVKNTQISKGFLSKIYYPRAAKDSQGTWHYILNGPQPFQGFLVERCKKDGCPSWTASPDYRLQCVQKTMPRKMLYIDLKQKKISLKYFKVPTCCYCSIIT